MLGFSFKKLNYGKQIICAIAFKKVDTKSNRLIKAIIKSARIVLLKRRTSFTQFSRGFTFGCQRQPYYDAALVLLKFRTVKV